MRRAAQAEWGGQGRPEGWVMGGDGTEGSCLRGVRVGRRRVELTIQEDLESQREEAHWLPGAWGVWSLLGRSMNEGPERA